MTSERDTGFSKFPETAGLIRKGFDERLHLGVQAYVARGGDALLDDAAGEARPGVLMTTETINGWMSATKPLVAVAVAQLQSDGALTLDDLVYDIVPEFSGGVKTSVTVRHLLTHTACFPVFDEPPPGTPWDEVIDALCALQIPDGCVPGETAAYHPASSWYMLGEVIRRISGAPVDRFLAERLFGPLAMESWSLGIDAERQRELGGRIGHMYVRTRNGDLEPHPEYNSPAGVAAVRPGSNGRGTAREFGRFYHMMLRRGRFGGRQVVSDEMVRLYTDRHRVGMDDATFRHRVDWGLGFIINSNEYGAESVPYGFGRHASRGTFGHGGRESSIAFGDPAHDLAVAVVFNGMPGEGRHQRRMREFLSALYEDLGLG